MFIIILIEAGISGVSSTVIEKSVCMVRSAYNAVKAEFWWNINWSNSNFNSRHNEIVDSSQWCTMGPVIDDITPPQYYPLQSELYRQYFFLSSICILIPVLSKNPSCFTPADKIFIICFINLKISKSFVSDKPVHPYVQLDKKHCILLSSYKCRNHKYLVKWTDSIIYTALYHQNERKWNDISSAEFPDFWILYPILLLCLELISWKKVSQSSSSGGVSFSWPFPVLQSEWASQWTI